MTKCTSDITVGSVLDGAYRIDRLIGKGGMGAVYDATDMTLERRVAIKVIQRVYSSIPDFRERFRREAVAMAQVDHPNVVRIHQCAVPEKGDGLSYLVMEYVEGETLAELLEREGRLPFGVASDLCKQVLRALHAIHRQGIVHRDLKPANIMLTRAHTGYRVRICDFGLGKMLEAEDPAHARTELTEVGIALGTPNYMSPEQCRGDRITETSDIYAVGVVLFEMLVGHPPFDGGSKHSIIMRHLTAPPPIDRLGADVPPEIRNVIAKSMAKDSAKRHLNAVSLLRTLNAVRPLPKPRGRGRIAAIAAACGLLLLVGVGYAFVAGGMSSAGGPDSVRKRIEPVTVPSPSKVTERKVAEGPDRISESPTPPPKTESVRTPVEVLPHPEWPKDAGALFSLAQRYSDEGDRAGRSEALRRYLAACGNARSKSCSPANRSFARARLRTP